MDRSWRSDAGTLNGRAATECKNIIGSRFGCIRSIEVVQLKWHTNNEVYLACDGYRQIIILKRSFYDYFIGCSSLL